MAVAFVFPGQGSQAVGMGKDLYDQFPAAKAVFDEADGVLGFSISKLCFEGPDEELKLTINAQPALVTMSYACLKAAGGKLPKAGFVAGHSLGEYSALAAAGVLDFASTVKVARERGRLMNDASAVRPGGMVAIIGLDEPAVAEICRESQTVMANLNSPGQIVISGPQENLPKAIELAKAKGASRAIPLAVSGAFHSPLMKPAADGLAKAISGIKFHDAVIPIIANVSAKPISSAEEIKTELVNQLTNGVQWQKSVEYLTSQGVSSYYEIGPGKVLAGLIKRINKEATVVNVSDMAAIQSLAG